MPQPSVSWKLSKSNSKTSSSLSSFVYLYKQEPLLSVLPSNGKKEMHMNTEAERDTKMQSLRVLGKIDLQSVSKEINREQVNQE